MDLRQLEYFTEIVRCKSLNKAAKNLFISQTALTKSMNVLEEELGLKLLNRSRQGVTVTEVGEQIYQDALQIIATRKHWNVFQHTPVFTEVQIAITPNAYSTFINVVISDILATNNYITVIPLETFAADMQETMYHSAVRLGITFSHNTSDLFPDEEIEKKGLKKTPIFHDYYRVYVGADHPWAKQQSVHISQLKECKGVLMEQEEYLNDFLFQYISKENCCITNNYRIHFFMALLHDYFTIWPSMVAQYNRFPVTGEIITLPISGIDENLLRLDYYLLHPPEITCSDEERLLINKIITSCKNISPNHFNDIIKPYVKNTIL